ncbi:ABC transporter permease [Desulfuribacillus stibiiarsenatis]|uniref:ABC transporter permease n=1 Tax=Desulfuribacillus stibiiarsenatis TaxID=1390249 RepID=A0A1E5L427_9FIRM|nr:ABC transporter permease [Desulfuribacillus stibiiarsenatis]OEH84900.1 ABC transporter permease [Desulfuribacillus stibiiarsenatis]
MLKLVENEVLKIIYKRKLLITLIITAFFVGLFAYGEHERAEKVAERLKERLGIEEITDWRTYVEFQLNDMNRRLDNPYITNERRARLQVQKEQLQYHLDQDINPTVVGSATFTRLFMEQSIILFLPLLVLILVSDLISGEYSGRTIKLLLTKPIPRWRILLSKIFAMIVMVTALIFLIVIISAILSSFVFGYGGWNAPVTTGFAVVDGMLDVSQVINVPQWQYIMMVYGLAWLVGICIGFMTIMVGIFVKNTGITIGIVMSTLIAGSFLTMYIEDWPFIQYFFIVHLNLTSYLSGGFQPVEGISLLYSVSNLLIWTAISIVISFITFQRQDVLS